MTFAIRIAEFSFQIDSIYEEAYHFCKDYLTDDKCFDYRITTSKQDLDFEEEIVKICAQKQGIKVRRPALPELEKNSIYRKIVELLFKHNIIMLHGSVVTTNRGAVLFTADSGVGKTTHTLLWVNNIENCSILNGDKPLLKIENSRVVVYGTPWCGKEHYGYNGQAELRAICILDRDARNSIKEIFFMQGLSKLYEQCYIPIKETDSAKMFRLIIGMRTSVKLYSIRCNTDKSAAYLAYNAVFEQ